MLFAEGDDLIFKRTLDDEGKDHFGRFCGGPKKVLCIMNRSDKIKMLVSLSSQGDVSSVDHLPDIFSGEGETGCLELKADQNIEKVEIRPLSALICIMS